MSPPAPPTTLAGGQQKKSTQNTKLLDAAAVYKKSVMNEGYGSANATAVHAKRPSTATQEDPFLGEELRIHARHIRDTLSPMLSFERVLSHTDLVLLRSIFRLLKSTTITIDLLRFSRMEKALQLIVVQSSDWPVETIVQAENTLLKWEDQLGQGSFKNLRADLWSEGGRLEGVRRIKDWRHRDDVCWTLIKLLWNLLSCNRMQILRGRLMGLNPLELTNVVLWASKLASRC